MKIRYLVLGSAALLAARYLSQKISRSPRRIRIGAIESPEMEEGYPRVTAMPQFGLMYRLVAARAVDGLVEGRALDVGSGPGRLAIEMAKRAPKLAVLGLDQSERMIELSSAGAGEAGIADRVAFIKGSADAIPYPEASFDLVVSTLSLHHWGDPVAVFNEISRVLRPGGRFLIVDLRRDVPLPAWLLLWFATHAVVPAGLREANEPMGSREAAYTPREVVEMLSRSTLQNWHVTAGPFWLAVESTAR